MDLRQISCRSLLLVFVFLLLLQLSTAVVFEVPFNLTKENLQAEISPTKVSLSKSPSTINFSLKVTNPLNRNVSLYFAERLRDRWKIIAEIGNVSAREIKEIGFTLVFEYAGMTAYTGKYAIISEDFRKYEFSIIEDWISYESRFKRNLLYAGFIIAPILAVVLAFILFLVAREAGKRVDRGFPGEYTLKSLFRIHLRGTFSQRVINLLSNPIIWLSILFLVFVLMSTLIIASYPNVDVSTLLQISITSVVSAFFIPILLMIFSWYADIYEREPLRFVVGMFIWGLLAAFLAFFINPLLIMLFRISVDTVPLLLVVVFGSIIISPIAEETLKALGVVFISGHKEMDGLLDGLLYGFVVGAGFAAVENWFYFISKVDPLIVGLEVWVVAIVYRSFFNTLAHGCFTAFIGAMIGMMKARPRFRKYSYLGILPGLFIAIILHMIFNLSAFLDIIAIETFQMVVLFFNPLLVITVAIGFIFLYYFGLVQARRRMESEEGTEKEEIISG